jgi:hypothetical protein
MSLEIGIGIIAALIAILSAYFAAKSAKHAKDSVSSSVILELSKTFHDEKISRGNKYLFDLRNENYTEFTKNPYAFAKTYLKNVDTNSENWHNRRAVARFWNSVGVFLKTGLLTDDLAFTLFPDVEVIEILEPIEMAMVDEYGIKGDPYMAFVYRKWQKWQKKAKADDDMKLPINTEQYAKRNIGN